MDAPDIGLKASLILDERWHNLGGNDEDADNVTLCPIAFVRKSLSSMEW